MTKTNKGGRPKIITGEVLQKLEQGFMKGLSDRQACLYADISPGTLYNYQKENPEFLERKELLKENIKMRAKLTIAAAIERGDLKLSQWYLKNKAGDEFSERQQIDQSNTNNPFHELTTEELRRLADNTENRE